MSPDLAEKGGARLLRSTMPQGWRQKDGEMTDIQKEHRTESRKTIIHTWLTTFQQRHNGSLVEDVKAFNS